MALIRILGRSCGLDQDLKDSGANENERAVDRHTFRGKNIYNGDIHTTNSLIHASHDSRTRFRTSMHPLPVLADAPGSALLQQY
jgi:hypothetical protein